MSQGKRKHQIEFSELVAGTILIAVVMGIAIGVSLSVLLYE